MEATDRMAYSEQEIERIGRRAFELARLRRKKVSSVDKANVLETSRLWRKVMHRLAEEYPDVAYEDVLVDNCAMQLVRDPGQFDVVVTENMFGDILSDEASMVTGSIGLLPSASIGDSAPGLYEPIHGSAPRHRRPGQGQPHRHHPVRGHDVPLLLPPGPGEAEAIEARRGRGAGRGLAHRRHRRAGRNSHRDQADGRADSRQDWKRWPDALRSPSRAASSPRPGAAQWAAPLRNPQGEASAPATNFPITAETASAASAVSLPSARFSAKILYYLEKREVAARMVLAIDVGNSTTTIGLFDESGVLHLRSDLTTSQRSTRDQCAVSLRGVFDLYGRTSGPSPAASSPA